jgi:hypothetical protein
MQTAVNRKFAAVNATKPQDGQAHENDHQTKLTGESVKPSYGTSQGLFKMAGRFQIKCINKPNRDSSVEHITHVGAFGTSQWKLTVEDVIARIERTGPDHEDFFVKVGQAEANVIVVSPVGRRKHIRTTRDLTVQDNLLSLPECP